MTLQEGFIAFTALAAVVLAWGGIRLWRTDRMRAMLMIGVALVTLVNLWSWGSLVEEVNVGNGVASPPSR